MSKLVCILDFANAQSLDINGPLEVLALASRQHQAGQPGSAPRTHRMCRRARGGTAISASGARF